MVTKAEIERAIFREFVGACSLPIVPGSIESREPPEPDILCALTTGEQIAFELVESIDSGLAAAFDTTVELPRFLRKHCPTLPGLGSGGLIAIDFKDGISKRAQIQAISPLVEELKCVPAGHSGNWPVTDMLHHAGVQRIGVVPRDWGFLDFQVSPVTSISDPAPEQLAKKFGKNYGSEIPIELLVYYDLQPCHVGSGFGPNLARVVSDGIQASPFRRVWVYDRRSKRVWAYPPIRRISWLLRGVLSRLRSRLTRARDT